MGIRTKVYVKASSLTDERKKEEQSQIPKEEDISEAPGVEEQEKAKSSTSKSPGKIGKISKSAVKLRTPASMARLGGIKVGTRKLKKHRKRTLYVHAANKILRTSIKSNKSKRTTRASEEKARGSTTALPCRTSTRTCVRRNSREGIPESPLRTVELIKRPVELREPATKLLFMASLGLYPQTGESDMTPIVVVKELCSSPGKKNGVRKSLELPLIPFHKRYIDLSNQDKRSFSENIKPATSKQGKKEKEQQKVNPDIVNNNNVSKESTTSKSDAKKSTSPSNLPPPPPVTVNLVTQNVTANSKDASKCKTSDYKPPPPPVINGFKINNNSIKSTLATASTSTSHSLTITPAINKLSVTYSSEAENSASKPKSLLKNKLTVSSTSLKEGLSFYLGPNSKTNFVTPEAHKPMSSELVFNSYEGLPSAMNLMLSNVSIIPKQTITVPSRKRSASPKISDLRYMEQGSITNANMNGNYSAQDKRRRLKSHKNIPEAAKSVQPFSLTVPVSSKSISPSSSSSNNFYSQSNANTPVPEEALNLCVKNRPSVQPIMTTINNNKLPPKLQNTSNAASDRKQSANGQIPLNLVIPRPPPLMKAPLEITNIANSKCPQNVKQAAKAKSQPKKPRKPRQKTNQPAVQMQQFLPTLPPVPLLPADTTVHAKSLLKCMNGEENACVREVGESLDSVKTMLARLQTSIGPAVNGVRLITIE
ncbi:unnamed protein product [Orchesella dallaii]|uniref:Uncharacterized protein n=1 Tax=Orchesella dallaii TaxID=48710 RepID=A0ABP1RD13_9HEXA